MTREEALNILHNASVYHPDYLDALNMAIKALEQEPRKDEVILTNKEYRELISNEYDHGYEKGYLEALEQEPKWIPVSERLPKDGGDYFVTIAFDIGGKEPVREVKKDYFCILSKKWLYEEENVVAWMPLPETYKAESEG